MTQSLWVSPKDFYTAQELKSEYSFCGRYEQWGNYTLQLAPYEPLKVQIENLQSEVRTLKGSCAALGKELKQVKRALGTSVRNNAILREQIKNGTS